MLQVYPQCLFSPLFHMIQYKALFFVEKNNFSTKIISLMPSVFDFGSLILASYLPPMKHDTLMYT